VSEQPTAARCHHPQVAREGQVDLRGGVVAWREWATAATPPVVFLHGTPGSRLFIPDPTLDHRVITFDRPGYGLSTPLRIPSLSGVAEIVTRVAVTALLWEAGH
jgi:pimeloyl-ACP methyl ester carboxylesterase